MSRFDQPPRGLPIREIHRQGQVQAKQGRTRPIDVTLTPSSVGANSTSEQSFTVAGVPSNAQVIVNGPTQTSGIVMGAAYVSAKNTVVISFANVTGGGLTPTSGTYTVRPIR